MRIIIIGPNGQLGSELMSALADHTLIGLDHSDFEITDSDSIQKLISHNPDIIINTAAYHRFDECENNPKKAFEVNAIGAKNIAEACNTTCATAIYISTDYVFDGKKGIPYDEDDTPNPINTYGISKFAGEQYTRLSKKHYIIRTSSLFGKNPPRGKGQNFVEAIIKKASTEKRIEVIDDMTSSPTYAKDASKSIKEMIENKVPFGTYHLTNTGHCTWYGFAEKILELTGIRTEIIPLKSPHDNMHKKPHFTALKSTKLEKYNIIMPQWQESLKAYLKEKNHIK